MPSQIAGGRQRKKATSKRTVGFTHTRWRHGIGALVPALVEFAQPIGHNVYQMAFKSRVAESAERGADAQARGVVPALDGLGRIFIGLGWLILFDS